MKPMPAGATAEERREAGRSLRAEVPRSAHAEWDPAVGTRDPVGSIATQEEGRIAELLPIRHERMAVDNFAFYRGAASVMADDLARTATSGLRVQACGDAHLANFGLYATPERRLVFDLNDFDETLPAPFEWDVKRLAASLAVLARERGASHKRSRAMVEGAVAAYHHQMDHFSKLSHLELFYTQIDADDAGETIEGKAGKLARETIAKARRRTNLQAFGKLTKRDGGSRRIVDDPPLVEHVSEEGPGQRLGEAFESYIATLPVAQRTLIRRYRYVDSARKVVGVGSVGTECDVVLFLGDGEDDPLLLQVKEANASVLEPHAGRSRYRQHGKRVVLGQQQTQAASDIFLGWLQLDGRDLYVRQLRDMKGAAEVEALSPSVLGKYARFCATALARAHARSGDPAMITGYLGRGTHFEEAVAEFSILYAKQNEDDRDAFLEAIESGRFPVPGRKRGSR